MTQSIKVPQLLGVRIINLTKVASNISDVEWAFYMQYGKLVIVSTKFTVSSDITGNTAVLFSGLPPRITNMNFQVVVPNITDFSQNRFARININNDGKLTNWYTTGGIKPGQYIVNLPYFRA